MHGICTPFYNFLEGTSSAILREERSSKKGVAVVQEYYFCTNQGCPNTTAVSSHATVHYLYHNILITIIYHAWWYLILILTLLYTVLRMIGSSLSWLVLICILLFLYLYPEAYCQWITSLGDLKIDTNKDNIVSKLVIHGSTYWKVPRRKKKTVNLLRNKNDL